MSNIKQSRTTLASKDDTPFPIIQNEYNVNRVTDATLAMPYGLHANPVVKTPAILVNMGNDEGNQYLLPLSAKNRPQLLKASEVEVGNFEIMSTIKFDELGNVIATIVKDLTVTVGGNVDATVVGTMDAVVGGNTTLTTPLLTLNGNFLLNGSMTFGTVSGGGVPEVDGTFDLKSTSTMNAKGTIDNTGSIGGSGTITEGTINLKTHKSSLVQPGVGTSGVPVP